MNQKVNYRKGKTYEEIYGKKMGRNMRKKKSIFFSNLKRDKKWCERIGNGNKNKIRSRKTKKILREIQKKRWENNKYRDMMIKSHKGKKCPEHSNKMKKLWKNSKYRKKMVNSHIGYIMPELQKKNISISNKGKPKPQGFSEHLKIIRMKQILPKKDTSIEVLIQKELKRRKIEFKKHYPILGQPDIFIEPNLCIFCDGNYWHNYPKRNKRDRQVNYGLKKEGYIILRLWESDIRNNLIKCMDKIGVAING